MGIPKKGFTPEQCVLKQNIRKEVQDINLQTLRAVMDSLLWRARSCIALYGCHLEEEEAFQFKEKYKQNIINKKSLINADNSH